LRSRPLAAAVLAAAAIAGCELEETTAPPGTSFVLVHAILHPYPASFMPQQVLLERTWDGVNYVWQSGPPYSSANPVATGGGTAEIRAVVELITPSGEVIRATEPNADTVNNACCAGLYRIALPGASLQPGGTYELRIRTTRGELLTTKATMPAIPEITVPPVADFNRSADTLRLSWSAVAHAAAYELVIENPYSNLSVFTESTTVRLTGLLRNIDAEGFPSAFLPGFSQRVSVFAVDTNYYDYYRSRNGSRGRGLVNRVTGGYGVLGATSLIRSQVLRVKAPFTRPAEGEYRYFGTMADSLITLITRLTLHVETPARDQGGGEALSGMFRARPRALAPFYFDTIGAYVGRKWGDSIEVAFLSQQRMTDTMEVFKARIVGDTIVGRYRQRVGTWRFLRVP
jgi:hypothetical protein